MLNKKNKIFLLFCKLSLTAALQVLVTYFGFIFFNNVKNGNISSLTHVFLGDIWLFLITYFMFLALTAFFLTLVSNEKNVLIRKHFLWVGFITNAIIFSSFLNSRLASNKAFGDASKVDVQYLASQKYLEPSEQTYFL